MIHAVALIIIVYCLLRFLEVSLYQLINVSTPIIFISITIVV